MLYGALLGDIIGSAYEFRTDMKTKDFPLFSEKSFFTDDTVMTLAAANALLLLKGKDDPAAFRKIITKEFRRLGREYPGRGYGGNFGRWLQAPVPHPYNSFGNGSAMRVSPVGWVFDSLEKTREYAKASAEVTHNHPEGIKGAEATASAIWMARKGYSKERIKEYITKAFGYDLERTPDEIRPGFVMDESCQGTVPEAIICFLEARDFEDTIRNAVSLGGDTDTLAAIAGSIAEAFYGIPEELAAKCRTYMDDELLMIVDNFTEMYA